jgi:ribosomal protein S18 acetylase RimI-like enzyme
MIRKGNLADIDEILEITKACAKKMNDDGIYQWNDQYPNRSAFETDAHRNELFVRESNNSIVGCIAISTLMDKEYKNVKWITNNRKNIYIHRLAIHPDHQGQGYAQQLMDYAEQFAIENNYTSIRLDTFSQNKRNQLFYELRGYKKLGDIYFPKQSECPFHCYELIL